jgi:hypothetical protein
MSSDADGNKIYQTNERKTIVKEQAIDRLFKGIDGIYEIIKNSQDPYSDPRIDFMTQFLMLFVFDKKKTLQMMDERDAMIEERTAGISDFTRQNRIIGRINLTYLAECFDLFDHFIGFRKKQVILELKDGESVKYANELNNSVLDYMFANRADEIDWKGVKENGLIKIFNGTADTNPEHGDSTDNEGDIYEDEEESEIQEEEDNS